MLLLCLLTYTIPFDSPIMDHIEYLQIRGLIDVPSIRPYEIGWIVSQIDALLINDVNLNKIDRKIVSSFNPLLIKNEDFSTLFHLKTEYGRRPDVSCGMFDYRLGGRFTNSIEYSQSMMVRRASEIDSSGGRAWRDFQIYLQEGFMRIRAEKLTFDIGRRNFLLGTGDDNSLLFSLDPQGYDGFLLFIPHRQFEFYGIFSILDAPQKRYISIHRFGLNIKKFFKVGYSEALLFARSLEPLYVNFFFPWGVSQWVRAHAIDANIMLCLDGQLSVYNSIIYGELLIDDYQTEAVPYPNAIAYKIGLKSLILDNFLLKMNYTFVDKWVYTHELPINSYISTSYFYLPDSGHSLGFPLGNDVDKLSFSIKYMNTYGLYPSLSISHTRKGEGSIFLPYEKEFGPINPPFPSGVVEKKFDIIFGLDYLLRYNFGIDAHAGRRYWRNFNHTADNDRDELFFAVKIWGIL